MRLNNKVKILITCDSGAGAGKTTAAKYLSKKFKLNLLSSGLLYRYLAYKLIISKKKHTNFPFLRKIIKKINYKHLKNPILYLTETTEYTSQIAKVKRIRLMLKNYQIKFSKKKRAILEGRDMGILFPNADIKIFFKCSLKVAAKRRFEELKKIDRKMTLKKVEKAIKIRNHIDSTRKISPLRIPPGAVIVDTTKLNKKQMFRKVYKVVEKKLLLKYGRSYRKK